MTTTRRGRLHFYAPLVIATSIVVLLTAAMVQARLQPDLLFLTSSLAATGIFCISWQASLRLDGAPPAPTRLDVHRAGIILALGVIIGAGTSLLGCGFSAQPASACLRRSGEVVPIIVAVVAAPVIEEIVLRGYLGRLLCRVGTSVPLQLALQGCLFALAHGGAASSSRFALFFSFGLLLAALAIATRGLLASMTFHLAWNASRSLVPGDLRGSGLPSDAIAAATHASQFASAAAMLLLAAAVWRLWMPSAASAATGLAPLRR